jgi:hypothetical protein
MTETVARLVSRVECPPRLTRVHLEVLAAAVKLTVVAGENLTVGSTVWLPAESVAPGR